MTGLTRPTDNLDRLTTVGPPPTTAEIAEALQEQVTDGTFGPGDKLPSERALATQLGVSRQIVREILGTLQERGLVEVRAGRGTFARRPAPTEAGASLDYLVRQGGVTARQLITARSALESAAAGEAALRRTEEDLRRMQSILQAFEATPDTAVGAALDMSFHETVVLASHNQVLQIMFGSIRTLTHGVVLRSLSDRSVRHVGVPAHGRVAEAIRRRDAEAAREAMAHHMHIAVENYGEDLDQPLAAMLLRRAEQSMAEMASLMREASRQIAPEAARGEPVARGDEAVGERGETA